MDNTIHQFDNGIRVKTEFLLPSQLERYQKINLHEPEEEVIFLDMLRQLKRPDPIFFDIGAAIGYYAILAKKQLPDVRIWAFEPLPAHLDATRTHWTLNGLAEADIHLLKIGLSNTNGTAQLWVNDFSSKLTQLETFQQLMKRRLFRKKDTLQKI
ncbi:MAG: FkbM family methyltransferase, partial [Phaeodactylibacter sp.]|nr:FkbM family methyltransferase [Phaeodactylibacter sp.]